MTHTAGEGVNSAGDLVGAGDHTATETRTSMDGPGGTPTTTIGHLETRRCRVFVIVCWCVVTLVLVSRSGCTMLVFLGCAILRVCGFEVWGTARKYQVLCRRGCCQTATHPPRFGWTDSLPKTHTHPRTLTSPNPLPVERC